MPGCRTFQSIILRCLAHILGVHCILLVNGKSFLYVSIVARLMIMHDISDRQDGCIAIAIVTRRYTQRKNLVP